MIFPSIFRQYGPFVICYLIRFKLQKNRLLIWSSVSVTVNVCGYVTQFFSFFYSLLKSIIVLSRTKCQYFIFYVWQRFSDGQRVGKKNKRMNKLKWFQKTAVSVRKSSYFLSFSILFFFSPLCFFNEKKGRLYELGKKIYLSSFLIPCI